MINKIDIKDIKRFNELGMLVNHNFSNLFDLSKILESKIECVYGYYIDELLVGFIHISKLYETIDIINIVVDEDYRKRGIGSKLINYIVNLDSGVTNIMLEVNEHNKNAIRMYLKNSFYEVSRRIKYYGNDTAIIMKRDV